MNKTVNLGLAYIIKPSIGMGCRDGACSNRPRQRIFRTAGASPCPTMTLDITPLNPNLPHTPYYQRKIGDFSTIIIHYSSFIIHLIKITPLNQNLHFLFFIKQFLCIELFKLRVVQNLTPTCICKRIHALFNSFKPVIIVPAQNRLRFFDTCYLFCK